MKHQLGLDEKMSYLLLEGEIRGGRAESQHSASLYEVRSNVSQADISKDLGRGEVYCYTAAARSPCVPGCPECDRTSVFTWQL